MKLVSAKLPEQLIVGLDELVSSGMYPNRSVVIRAAVRDMLNQDFWRR
jgi:Arc/MetJ-type ribon-helix-helix transcriptional regulator